MVSTARHCLEGVGSASSVGFGVGLYPSQPRATFRAAALHLHDDVDAALIVLTQDATAALPELEPIPVNRTSPANLRGQQVDGAGYGQTHDDSQGRYFAAVWLEQVGSSYLLVDGRGEQGLCFGDSGGPLLGPGPVLLGVESGGSETCVGEDQMTRLDAISAWIDAVIGGDPLPDECDGLDYLGRCVGAVAEWCENGQLQQVDCAAEGYDCGYVDDQTGWYCVESGGPTDDCGGLDYLGRCDGDVAVWCEDGQLQQADCAAEGYDCDYVDDQTGWYCVERAASDCGSVTANGTCDGDVAAWCVDGALQQRDCAAAGLVCRGGGDRAAACVAAAPPDAGGGTEPDAGPVPPTDDAAASGPDSGGPGGPDAGGPGAPDAGGSGRDGGGSAAPDSGGSGGGPGEHAGPAGGGGASGGCQAGGGPGAPWAALLLPLLALLRRRRALTAGVSAPDGT